MTMTVPIQTSDVPQSVTQRPAQVTLRPNQSTPSPRTPCDALASTETLLHRRDELPPGHPERARLRTRAIEKNLPLANRLACRYAHRGEPIEDLKQIAVLAMIRAVDGYDPDREVPFIRYAIPSVLGAIKRHFRDTTWGVQVPRRIQELDRRARLAAEELSQRWGRHPTSPELADHLEVSLDELLSAMRARQAYRPVSLNTPATETDTSERPDLIHQIGDFDRGYTDVDDKLALWPLLVALPLRERQILILRYYHQMTQARIALEVGLSQMHISRLLRQSLLRLRATALP